MIELNKSAWNTYLRFRCCWLRVVKHHHSLSAISGSLLLRTISRASPILAKLHMSSEHHYPHPEYHFSHQKAQLLPGWCQINYHAPRGPTTTLQIQARGLVANHEITISCTILWNTLRVSLFCMENIVFLPYSMIKKFPIKSNPNFCAKILPISHCSSWLSIAIHPSTRSIYSAISFILNEVKKKKHRIDWENHMAHLIKTLKGEK